MKKVLKILIKIILGIISILAVISGVQYFRDKKKRDDRVEDIKKNLESFDEEQKGSIEKIRSIEKRVEDTLSSVESDVRKTKDHIKKIKEENKEIDDSIDSWNQR